MINLERNNDALVKIAAKLRILRRNAGLTQKAVAQDTGLNIGCIEAAKLNFNVTTLKRLCDYYKIDFNEFFKDIDL